MALLHSTQPNEPQLQYIDRKGQPFLGVKPGADIDFPVITGLSDIDDPTVREKALAEALVFLKKVNSNNPYLPAQSVSEIHLARDGGASEKEIKTIKGTRKMLENTILNLCDATRQDA